MNFGDDDDEDEMDERERIETYMHQHNMTQVLNAALNTVLRTKPNDPFMKMKDLLKQQSKSQRGILGLAARKIFTSNAVPALEVDVTTTWGTSTASCCIEFPAKQHPVGDDGNEAKHVGAEEDLTESDRIDNLVEVINIIVARALKGSDPTAQKEIDEKLTKLTQPTPAADLHEEEVPGIPLEAIMPVSMAVCRAGAKQAQFPLYKYLSNLVPKPADGSSLADEQDETPTTAATTGQLPVPMFSMLGGSSFGTNQNYIQEILLMPDGASDFNEAMEIGVTVYNHLKELCKKQEWRDTGAINPGCMGVIR
jgi:enolase